MEPVKHPAKYSGPLFPVFAQYLEPGMRVLDPFAGVGGVFALLNYEPSLDITGIEIEKEWASQHPDIICGDARVIMSALPSDSYDIVITSPTYGNRMADHHNAKDHSTRNTYTHTLGRPLSHGNSGAMHWGPAYRNLHRGVWEQVHRVLCLNGLFVLNIKNHMKQGVEVDVARWHRETAEDCGFTFITQHVIPLYGNQYGANRERTTEEYIYAFKK